MSLCARKGILFMIHCSNPKIALRDTFNARSFADWKVEAIDMALLRTAAES